MRFFRWTLLGLLASLAACNAHPQPADVTPPTWGCGPDASAQDNLHCTVTHAWCADDWYMATAPDAGTCSAEGICQLGTPTLTECPCGCPQWLGRCQHCGSTAP